MPAAAVRPYIYYGETRALCSHCLRLVDAKELIQDGSVYLSKRCPEHGIERVLIASDAEYWRRAREQFLKPPEQVARYNTGYRFGCPHDCGICPDHEQHGCLSLLEITDNCNLRCPTCYAASSPERASHRSLTTIERMLDRIVQNEVTPDVVQISGGEPTLHPQFFDVLSACKARPIRHLMVNTNGVRIAHDRAFAERLASYAPGLEVYLQFDSLERPALLELRGADLRDVRERALATLNELNLSTTLVVTVKRGANDGELGAIIEFALRQRCVRGVTLQPVQDAGRNVDFDPARHRLTLTEVRSRVLEQSAVFTADDIIPVPCHPECIAMAYALKTDDGAVPLTRYMDRQTLLTAGRSTISYERDIALRERLFDAFSTGHSPSTAARSLRDVLCCLPHVDAPDTLAYDRVFRLIVLQFLDRHSLDVRNARRSCVHIAHPDGRRIMPFDTYNLFYRDELEARVLEPIRSRLPVLA
jgi:hypothetical protein